jgi:uncharacterized repeat protein (TIGR01451 family)
MSTRSPFLRLAGFALLGGWLVTSWGAGVAVRADLPLPLPAPGPVDPPAPVVTLRVRVPACAAADQEIAYRICIENCSPVPAHHVLVRNLLPPNARFVRASPEPHEIGSELHWRLGTLPPRASCEITLVLLPCGPGDIKNCARVQFEHGQCVCTRIAHAPPAEEVPLPPAPGAPPAPPVPPAPGVPPEPAPQPKPPVPPAPGVPPMPPAPEAPKAEATKAALALTMTGPKQRYVNHAAAFTITVSNTGTGPATNVLITNVLPPKTKLDRVSAGGRFLANQAAWLLGDLPPGGSRSVELALTGQEEGEVCNRALAVADGGLTAQAEACTRYRGVSALLLEVVDTEDPVAVGGETSYVIIVQNQGTTAATNVRVKAEVPPELKVRRVQGPEHELKQTPQGENILFEPVKALAPGTQLKIRVYVDARKAGDVRFRVELTADQLQVGGPVREEESTNIYDADGPAPPLAQPQGRPVRRLISDEEMRRERSLLRRSQSPGQSR